MKKIICPTDFSPAANNATEYAAKLAKDINAELQLLNIQELSMVEPIISGIRAGDGVKSAVERLEQISVDIKHTFNISCNYIVDVSDKIIEKAITSHSKEDSLLVMGTNGVDDIYQYFFGTNTYHVIKKAACPVLVIPEGVVYKPIKKSVFAWDYSKANKAAFTQLKSLLGIFTPEVIFLHISRQKSVVSDDVFRALEEDVSSSLGESVNISFDRVYSEDTEIFPDRIDEYMADSKADLLAITFYDRGILKNMFHGMITKKLSEAAIYPLLVLHV